MHHHYIIIWISNFFLCQAKFLQCHVFILASSHIFMITSSLGSALVMFLTIMNSMPLLIEFFLLDILQANVCLLWGKKCCPAKLLAISPLRKYLVRLIFTSIYMALITLIARGCALFWGLCVHLWCNWVHSTGFCLPFCGIFESGMNAQGCQMSPFNAAP